MSIFQHFQYTSTDSDDTQSPDLSPDSISGKYKTTVSTILSKNCEEIRTKSDNIVHYSASKKKLKELVTKHNDEIFSFLSEKIPGVLANAETMFRRYGQDIPILKGESTKNILRDINLDVSLGTTVKEFDDALQKINGTSLTDFIKQLKWIFTEYKTIGEEILALEIILFQKLETLDKLNNRIPLITELTANDALPELLHAFTKYADITFANSRIEDDYKQLVQAYKKWNICRQIVAIQSTLKPQVQEPMCSICLNEGVSHAIVPCGHTFCGNCARKQNISCYICRGNIRERIRLYFT